jgi:hypothetical protein
MEMIHRLIYGRSSNKDAWPGGPITHHCDGLVGQLEDRVAIDYRYFQIFGSACEEFDAGWKERGGLEGYPAHVHEIGSPAFRGAALGFFDLDRYIESRRSRRAESLLGEVPRSPSGGA